MTGVRHTALTGEIREAFDAQLARVDQAGATALVLNLLHAGVGAEELLLGLIAPAQGDIGARWAANQWTVAQEHAATGVSEQTVAALVAAAPVTSPPEGVAPAGTVVVACVEGEWHSLPARILTEVLRLRGFPVRFLGAHVPTPELISYAHQHRPDLVALSCMLPVRLPRAHHMIEASRLAGIPVLAGGPGFGPAGVWARALGADHWAPDAAAAADLLTTQWPPPPAETPVPRPGDDNEYTRLIRRRPELLRQLVDRLHQRFPPMDGYTAEQQQAMVEDLGQLLDFLAAGIFVDDPRVLTDFLTFSTEVLTVRRVPPASLHLTVQTLTELLPGLPRTRAQLAVGRERLERAGHAYTTAVARPR